MRWGRLLYKKTRINENFNSYIKENSKEHIIGKARFKGFFINNVLFYSEKMKKYYSFINMLSKNRTGFVPAAHWIVDNYYVIKREAQSILKSIDKKEIKKLPRITSGHLKGIPRVYLLANLILRSQDYHVDEEMVVNYINVYQENKELDVEEIVHLGIMLKISILEKLFLLSKEVYSILKTKKNADILFNKIVLNKKPYINTSYYCNSAFISHVIHRLSEADMDEVNLINRLNEWAGKDINISELLNNEKEIQTKLQVELSTLVKSLINTAS